MGHRIAPRQYGAQNDRVGVDYEPRNSFNLALSQVHRAVFSTGFAQHDPALLYHTSDYDIGNITTQFIGTGLRMAPPGGVLGIHAWNALELRYGHYTRSTGLVANSLTLLVKVK